MKTYSPVMTFPSSSNPNKEYTVSVDEEGNLSCDCKAWVFKKTGLRTCPHVRQVERMQTAGELGRQAAPGPAQAAASEKGGSLTRMFRKMERTA